MIDIDLMMDMRNLLQDGWDSLVKEPDFLNHIKSSAKKDKGHSLSPLAQEKTTNMLRNKYQVAVQTKDGEESERSMGDFWVKPPNCSTYIPMNNKFTFIKDLSQNKIDKINKKVEEKLAQAKTDKAKYKIITKKDQDIEKAKILKYNGQPNLVSANRLLKAMIDNEINSYYLVIESLVDNGFGISVSVYLADLLDLLMMGYITFDAGPGQLMLKSAKFYDFMHNEIKFKIFPISQKNINDKIWCLYELMRTKTTDLIENRTKSIEQLKFDVSRYQKKPLEQSRLEIKPL
jgi:hypothetical protein